jgi:hypothetical protein
VYVPMAGAITLAEIAGGSNSKSEHGEDDWPWGCRRSSLHGGECTRSPSTPSPTAGPLGLMPKRHRFRGPIPAMARNTLLTDEGMEQRCCEVQQDRGENM